MDINRSLSPQEENQQVEIAVFQERLPQEFQEGSELESDEVVDSQPVVSKVEALLSLETVLTGGNKIVKCQRPLTQCGSRSKLAR